MTNGLKILQLPGRYAGYSVTLVGWLRRVNGDEWALLPGARAIRLIGEPQGLGWLAANGIGNHYEFIGQPSGAIEHVHRLVIRRALEADETKYADDCPRPKDWE